MKTALILLLVLLSGAATHAYADNRLMTDAEYKRFLIDLDSKLPVLEAALKKVDPAKTNASYTVGAQVVQFRDLALQQAGYAHEYILKQQSNRTVSGELGLEAFLRGIFDAMESMMIVEISAGVTISSDLDTFAPQVSKFDEPLANDVIARVELLEKGTCH